MKKMSVGVATLFIGSLAGLACTNRSGLNTGGGSGGDLGGANGGQAGGGSGGITGGSGGAVGSGGLVAGGSQAGSGGISGTGGCFPPPCALLDCPYGYVPSSSPCGCGECSPPPNAGGGAIGLGGAVGFGGTGAGGTGGTVSCPSIMCAVPACVGGEFRPNPSDPCCPVICVPNIPDAGVTRDAGVLCGPIACPMLACVNGYLPSSEPCGCPTCAPPDAGVAKDAGRADAQPICPPLVCSTPGDCVGFVPNPDPCLCPLCVFPDAGVAKDAGRADTPPICPPIACPAIACVGGTHANPDPCGCPLCGLAPDGGVAKDATPPTGCPMLASLNPTDAAQVGYSAGREFLECSYAGGTTEDCISSNATGCPGTVAVEGGLIGCSNLCAASEYGLSYGGVGPSAAPPSIDLPVGCKLGLQTPGGPAFYCCPCGQ
jgi:hypothetical protein